jgi:hypothetical protein
MITAGDPALLLIPCGAIDIAPSSIQHAHQEHQLMFEQASLAGTEVTPNGAGHSQPDCDPAPVIEAAASPTDAANRPTVEKPNSEDRAMPEQRPRANDPFHVDEGTTHRYRRLLRYLIQLAGEAERLEPRRRHQKRTWDQSVIALIDQPEYDDFDYGQEREVVDGDVEKALQDLIDEMSMCMTGHLDFLEHDAALAHRGRILAILRNSPSGPVLTRFDADPPPGGDESEDTACTATGADDENDVRRVRWVSTAETRAMAEHAFRRFSFDRYNPWLGGVAALIDAPDVASVRELPTQVYNYPSQKNLDAAIATACEAMLPISDDRPPLDPEHPEPLRRDVALTYAGRIRALVKYSEVAPIVYRFRDLWPGMV